MHTFKNKKEELNMSRLGLVLIFGLVVGAGIFSVIDSAFADSLWQRRVTINHNLFDDNRGKRIGDIVTVIVTEETSVDNDETANTKNASKHSGEISNNSILRGIKTGLLNGRNEKFSARAANNYSSDFSQDFSGQGSYDSSRKINMRLTAMVVEVLDNGNLLLEGRRRVAVNKENYTLKLTGIARPIDIGTDNIIQSNQMSNVSFSLEGQGWLTRAGQKGWFNRLQDIFWPF
jgi:flagellar L-ring protein precursor FlgH